MLNNDKKVVDVYIPRKCSATNRLIAPDDHASVQFNLGNKKLLIIFFFKVFICFFLLVGRGVGCALRCVGLGFHGVLIGLVFSGGLFSFVLRGARRTDTGRYIYI
jgi:hypothetical protein